MVVAGIVGIAAIVQAGMQSDAAVCCSAAVVGQPPQPSVGIVGAPRVPAFPKLRE